MQGPGAPTDPQAGWVPLDAVVNRRQASTAPDGTVRCFVADQRRGITKQRSASVPSA